MSRLHTESPIARPRILAWDALDDKARQDALARPDFDTQARTRSVAEIIEAVKTGGDAAVRDFSARFDGVELEQPEVPAAELEAAVERVEPALLAAIDRAIGRIQAFHAAGLPRDLSLETAPGLLCSATYRPISPVGLYAPGGSAPLISTVIMLAVPALLAGCKEIVLCTPPSADGSVDPALLATARRCGVQRVFRIGGAQAIAAMAFGTESVPSCAKLYGPGNAWVTEAKQQVAMQPDGAAQDMPAGPSEVMVIADGDADPTALAWDLLSQAEHGPDSQSLLLSDDDALLEAVARLLPRLAADSPRSDILAQSLDHARLLRVASIGQAIGIANDYAPEHLIINCADADRRVESITTAGSVFVGPWTPESLGDYCSGTNHVLPTYGYARAFSGLSVGDFLRRMTVQRASAEGLREAGPDAMAMAAAEGLSAHYEAVAWRLATLDRDPGGKPDPA
jgi:histidinol dehydrogenase